MLVDNSFAVGCWLLAVCSWLFAVGRCPLAVFAAMALFACTDVRCQQPIANSKQPISISQQAVFAGSDALHNLYLITKAKRIEKYDSTGRLLTHYLNKRLGLARSFDVSNPMKIVLWYADYQTVVFLDRNLAEMGILRLNDVGFQQVTAVCASSDGNLWLYDASSFKLYKVNAQGNRLFESQEATQFELIPQSPTEVLEQGGLVWMSDPHAGFWTFDLFGQLTRAWKPLHPALSFSVNSNTLRYCSTAQWIQENATHLESSEHPYPKSGNWMMNGSFLIFLSEESVEFYPCCE